MYTKDGAGVFRSSDIWRWVKVPSRFALCSAERFLTFWLCVAVQVYKKFLSPLQYALRITFGLQCECRFRPTCSEYALGCLRKHHLPMACFLIAKRLLRCQPLGRGGWDPVP
ncbi:MAG: membrane protein insertion efficiency factor YidD [Opitutales bacterium]|nr:membrane protein insertion efficiency factor YidD [Opitutales bacterium]